MMLKSPLSNQTQAIYTLLLEQGVMNAEEISQKLHIFPQAVYRSINVLQSLGCINRLNDYPARFLPKPVSESVETFSLKQRDWFMKTFVNNIINTQIKNPELLNISFIENRAVMFDKELADMQHTQKNCNLLISGDGAPAEVMLENKRMVERGVDLRMLVQKRNSENEQLLQSYKKIGIEVRVYKPVQSRIMIFDEIVYFMSFDPENIQKSVGVRFVYAPIAQLMNTLFMHYWNQATEIK